MYQGKNPTAIHSQRAFVEAMTKLLKRTRYEEINVSDICKKAELSRQTYYQIFVSKGELMEYVIRLNLEKLEQVPDDADLTEQVEKIMEYVKKNTAFINLMYENHIQGMYMEAFSARIGETLDRYDPDRERKSGKIANAYMSGALCNALLAWVRGASMSEEGLLKLLLKIMKGKYYRIG